MIKALTSILLPMFAIAISPQLAASDECQEGEIVIRFSHVTNADKHPKGIAASLLEKRINEEMDGKACMQVFPNSTLYDDNKVLEALLQGDIQLAAPSLSKFETYTRKFRLFDLPFVFKDIQAVDAYQASGGGRELLNSMQRVGLQGLTYWHNGMKQISADRPLLVPEDAAGLRFRVQKSDVLVAQFKALGANPQKLAFSETYDALKTQVIHGQENTWSNIYGKKFFEVQDGVTESNHGIVDYLVVTSSSWWAGLPKDVREQFGLILSEVTNERNAAAAAVNQENKELILRQGGVVYTLTEEQRAKWIAAMKPVWVQFESDIGEKVLNDALSFSR